MTAAEEERRQITAAIDRLIGGTPLRSDGNLTIVDLAVEADVKRWVLTHKHTDLKDLFNARLKAAHQQPPAIQQLHDRVTQLEAANTELKRELALRNQALDAMARWLNLHSLRDNDPNPSPPRLLRPAPPNQTACSETTPPSTTS